MKNPPSPMRVAMRAAFTLIELLTVIAIIGILAAIIIPVTGRVRESAKQATCLNNLRQIGIACAMYSADNKNRLNYQPAGTPVAGDKWGDRVGPYMSASATNTSSAKDNSFTCPSRIKSSLGTDYAINALTCKTNADGTNTGVNVSAFGDLLSKKVYFIDSQAGTAVRANSFFRLPEGRDPVTDTSGTYLTWRHSGKCNLLFLDGHVATLGFPPLPTSNDGTANNWLAPGVAAPSGI